jgi:hypothetical protein
MEMTVRDTSGNEALCEFDVVVRDIQIPQIGVPDGAGKQCGGPRVQTIAFDDDTKVNQVSYADTYNAVCPNGYSCQALVGSQISTCQPAPTCSATTLVQNGDFLSGMSGWPCYHKTSAEYIKGDCHTHPQYQGFTATGHLHGHCHEGTQGGIHQEIMVAAGSYKLKFKAFAGIWDNGAAAADTDHMQVRVTGTDQSSWTTTDVAPEHWQDVELSFTTGAGQIDIQMWSDANECIDVVDIVIEQCTPTYDVNSPSSVDYVVGGDHTYEYGTTAGTGSGSGSAVELMQDDLDEIMEE